MSSLKWLVLLLAALLAAASAGAQTFPPLTGRVVDDAHLLSSDQVARLTARSAEIEKASSRQFVVATIPNLQGYPIEDYGYRLGRAWKIGQGGANNGIILIVAPRERKVRIEVGRGLEPVMTDALSSVIVNQTILPKFRAGDMAGGIVAGSDAIAGQMKLPLEAAEQRSAKILAAQNQRARAPGGSAGFQALPVILVVLAIAFVGLSFFRRGVGGQRYSGGSGIGSTVANVALWSVLDGLSSHDRGGSWGGGASGWGGGSDDGGGFSGGGGDFGGGGASGDW